MILYILMILNSLAIAFSIYLLVINVKYIKEEFDSVKQYIASFKWTCESDLRDITKHINSEKAKK